MTSVELIIHLDSADDGVVWWAESPEAPGFTAAADSLAELRELATTGLRGVLGDVSIVERLDGVPLRADGRSGADVPSTVQVLAVPSAA